MHSECKSDILCQTTVRSVCVCVGEGGGGGGGGHFKVVDLQQRVLEVGQGEGQETATYELVNLLQHSIPGL